MSTYKLPTIDEVTFEVSPLPEDLPVRGNACATGDDETDKEVEDALIKDLESGNEWAWCCVEVCAVYVGPDGEELRGNAYVGGCSYRNQKDFEHGGYFEDLKTEALADLHSKIEYVIKRGTTYSQYFGRGV